MDKIHLVKPRTDMKHQAIDFKNEFFTYGERAINGSSLWDKTDDYDEWLENVTKNADKETVSPGWVVTDVFFAVRESDGKIIGMIDLRHELNEFLQDFGHSGYSVRPLERKKGYATEMLRQVLGVAKQIGLSKVQLSCEKDNIPSVKTIENNGGVYERSFQFEGRPADVFIVTL